MAFIINTTGVVTLTDLGNRILSSGLNSFDLGVEFKIEELRYSADLASAIQAGTLEVVDDGRGRGIVGPVSAGVATEFVSDIFHFEDADVTSVINSSSIEDFVDVTLTSPLGIGEALTWNGVTWENNAVASGVTSVNTQTGVVVLDTDDLLEGTNKFYATSLFDTDFGTKSTTDLTEGTNLYYTDARSRQAISVAAGSANYLGYNNTSGELSISALAITTVDVDVTETSLANWISSNYFGSPLPFEEGDVIILTAVTGGTETYIQNGGAAGTSADWSLIQQPNVDQTTVRGWFSATAPITYNSGTGDFDIDLKANGGLVIETNELAIDLGASAITGTLAVGDGGTGLISTPTNGQLLIGNGSGYTLAGLTQGDDITVTNGAGTISIGITDASIDAGKLDDGTSPTAGQYLTAATASATSAFVWATLPATKKTWSWGASSSASNTTNRFLDRHDGTPTNQSGYTAFFASKLRAISCSTNGAESWTAEVYVNGASVSTIVVSAAATGTSTGLDISVAAGDIVSFYCTGTGINKPSIDALFEEA